MISIIKKLVFVIAFVLLTLVLPCVVLLLFVDAAQNFAAYVITYGVIIFAILGYIIASVHNLEKKVAETMEEIKMQNAAIAYKLTNVDSELSVTPPQPQPQPQSQPQPQPVVQEVKEEEIVDTNSIPLNPAEPLVMPTVKKEEKAGDDGFDDFK